MVNGEKRKVNGEELGYASSVVTFNLELLTSEW